MKQLVYSFVLVGILTTGGLAFAQLDPANDGIGVYFDTEASIHRITLLEGEHHAYLAITNPTDPSGISGWECRVDTDGPLFVLDWGVLGLAINASTPPSFTVGLADPLPFAPRIILMDMVFMLTSLEEASFYIRPIFNASLEGVPAYASGADPAVLSPLSQSTGGPEIPVAVINGDAPVATEDATWGGVKNLYR
jgi:hypothetical protein